MRSLILLALAIISLRSGLAQKEAFNWYFGAKGGMTFNTTPPSSMNNSVMYANYISGSISTPDGRLLFYTDGRFIWDSTDRMMGNSVGMRGSSGGGAGETVVIMRHRDSSNIFFVYTIETIYSPANGFYCTVVDMNLNSGRGDVVNSRKNIFLMDSASKCLAVARHSNGKDFWFITHKYNTDTICAFRITETGKFDPPVYTKINQYYLFNGMFKTHDGSYNLKASPDGTRLVMNCTQEFTTLLMDFNTSDGSISNVFTLGGSYWGLEFSARSKYMYLTTGTSLIQFNAKASNFTDLWASRRTIDSTNIGNRSALQMGPDGKIYEGSEYFSLGVINAPDSLGFACRYKYNAIPLSGRVVHGLPYYIPEYLKKRRFSVFRKCLYESTLFTLWDDYKVDSLYWDFGDGKYLKVRESPDSSYHIYRDTGSYTAKLVIYYKNYSDTFSVKFNIVNHQPDLGRDTVFCRHFRLKLSTPGTYTHYFWPHDSSFYDFTEVYSGGTYVLNVVDTSGCRGTDTVRVLQPKFDTRIYIPDSLQCFDSNLFKISYTSDVKDDTLKSILWNASDGTSSGDSLWLKSFSNSGKYKITLFLSGTTPCRDTAYSDLEVYSDRKKSISVNNDSACLENNQFIFDYNPLMASRQWDFGDGMTSSAYKPSKTYAAAGKYKVNYTGTDSNGCVYKDSLNIFVIRSVISAIGGPDTQCLKGNLFRGLADPGKLQYDWDMGDGSTMHVNDVTHSYAQSGSYRVILKTKDSFLCTANDTFKVTILESPEAEFGMDTMKCSDIAIFIDESVNSRYISWQIDNDIYNSSSVTYKIKNNAQCSVMLIAFNAQHLCPDTLETHIDFGNLLSGGKPVIPNVFTPGTIDNFNDCYRLGGLNHDCGDIADIQIFNRWGILVFEGDLATECWDGTMMNKGDELAAGTYFYILNIRSNVSNASNNGESVSGVIYLIR